MKKYWWLALILIFSLISGILFFVYNNNSNNNPNYSAEKADFNTTLTNTSDNIINTPKPSSVVEKEIASFSTKIQNKKDSNRQGNITITCSALTNTIVKPGETFSFCDVVGESTKEKGYKEANVIIQGIETKGLGGGNCQVSSTLYNAVLAAPELEVVERHPHSAPVPYIEEGKDAAISYGSHDFKFKNNSNSPIKVVAENTPDNITIKLIKLIKE